MNKEKVILAYSGGLDTSCAIKWLQNKYQLDVVTLAVDLGQPGNLKAIQTKALKVGAVKSLVADVREEFAKDFVLKSLQTNAVYEGKYPLATALARPLIAKALVEVTKKVGAKHIAHGCTAKGNDQVRFDIAVQALAPNLKVIAPLREWRMSRKEEIDYAKKNKIPVEVKKKSPYSIDENLWGRSVECGVLEDPYNEPPEDAYAWTTSPEKAPNKPTYLEIDFVQGVPKKINGKAYSLVELISRLNKLGGANSVGRLDVIENRLVGIKSREVYECPAATILITAHRDLESLVLPRELLHYKHLLEQKYAELIYYGLWFDPLKNALDGFVKETQQAVTGTVKLKLYKGRATVVGRKSPKSLYDFKLATYEKEDAFSHKSAEGFIELWGLPLKVWARKHRKK